MTSYIFEENKHMGLNMCLRIKKSTKMGRTYQNKFITRLSRMKKYNKISKFKRTLGKKANNQSQIKIKLKLDNKSIIQITS